MSVRTDLPWLRHRRRPAPAAAPVVAAEAPSRARVVEPRPLGGRRTARDTATVLTPAAPTVTLTRIQSGVGVLTFEAVCPESAGALRLGCAYRLRSGLTSVVQHGHGPSAAPPGSARPLILGERRGHERLTVDLVQSRALDRLLVYAYSGTGAAVQWGGTLTITTAGQARVQVPLERPPSAGVLVVASIFNVRGEFVLRAELEDVPGSPRDACTAYGYDQITWLDGATPVT